MFWCNCATIWAFLGVLQCGSSRPFLFLKLYCFKNILFPHILSRCGESSKSEFWQPGEISKFWTKDPYQSTNEFQLDSNVSLSDDIFLEECTSSLRHCWVFEKDYDVALTPNYCPSPYSLYTLTINQGQDRDCPNPESGLNCIGIVLPQIKAIHFFMKYIY